MFAEFATIEASGDTHHAAQSSINVVITKRPLQDDKGWLSRAMARCDVIELPLIVQRRCDALDVRVSSLHQVQASEQDVNVRVNPSGCVQDFFYTCVRTSVHND